MNALIDYKNILLATEVLIQSLQPDESVLEDNKLTLLFGRSVEDGVILFVSCFEEHDYVFSIFKNRKLIASDIATLDEIKKLNFKGV